MFCRQCGGQNDDRAAQCIRCGAQMQALPTQPIENHLVLAIIITVLCCLPCGIVGIVYAAQVNGKALSGDLAGARDSARKAKLWSYWGLGLGLALWLFYLVAAVLGGLADAAR